MAVSRDSTTEKTNILGHLGGSSTATATWAHTCSSSNTVLIVAMGLQGGNSTNYLGVTYNAVTMTQLTTNGTLAVYYLVSPTVGTNNIIATVDDSGFKPFAGMSASFNGAKQTGFPDSSAIPTGSAITTFSPSTSVVTSGCWLFAIGGTTNFNNQLGVGAGTTGDQYVYDNGNLNSYVIGDSNGSVGTGSQALNFTSTSTADWEGIILSIAPVAVASGDALLFIGD